MQYITSKHLLQAKEVYSFDEKIAIVTEWMPGKSLPKYLEKHHKELSEESCKYMVYIITSALKDLHDENFIHRDVKTDSVLLRPNDGKILLAGLSSAAFMDKNYLTEMEGTRIFMAPEMVLGQIYNKSVDYWGLGIIMYEIAFGVPPF